MKGAYDDDLKEIRDELELIAANGSEVWWRQERARQVRFNEWEGQSPDGRRHASAMDGEALPFEGAPDNRIPLVDDAIKEKVALAKRAFFRGMVQAKAIGTADEAQAANTTALLVWLRDREMREELDTEVELAAQYLYGDDPGVTVVETCWRRDMALELRTLTFDDLAEMYATGASTPEFAEDRPDQQEPEMMAEFSDLATNPTRRSEFVQWMQMMFPGVSGRAIRSAANDLRKTGQADLPVPAIRQNRPGVQALKLFDDIFFPIGTMDIQRARTVHRREWLTDVELRERVHTLGWDEEWVETVIAKGKGQSVLSYPLRWRQWAAWSVTLAGPGRAINERDNLYEVWWSYKRAPNELGIPGIYCAVWSSVMMDRTARTSVADYPDGEYPFVLRTRERLGRQTTDSRGMSQTITTHQQEIKIQRDARGAYVQMVASPPVKVKTTRGAYEMVIGPNAQIPVQKMDDFDLVTMPNFLQNSVEMEKVTRDEADHYAGLMRPDADQNRIGLIQQDEIDNFLALWRAVFRKVLAMAQVFYSEEELDLVTGQMDTPLHLTPEDVRGSYHISIEIDARDLNMEFVAKKMDLYGKVLSMDSGGSLDRTPYTEWSARAVDPILARQSIQPAGSVTKKMLDEERNNVSNMAIGIEPIMNPEGTTNPQFRLQTVQQTIQQSPKLMALLGADETFKGLLINYQKYLQQQIAQDQNKLIGRLGTAPQQGVPGLYEGQSQLMAPR
jgi:hypothetical protein